MGLFIQESDLAPFATIDLAKATAMIEDAEATTILIAPCLSELPVDDPKRDAVRAILRRAIVRWNDAGTGVIQQATSGPFSQSVSSGTNAPRSLFWPSEIEQLQGLCVATRTGAFEINTMPADAGSGYWSAPDVWQPDGA